MAEVTPLLQAMVAGDLLNARSYPVLSHLSRRHLRAFGLVALDPLALVHTLWLHSHGAEMPSQRASLVRWSSV